MTLRRLLLIGGLCVTIFVVVLVPKPILAQQEEDKKGDGKSLYELMKKASEKEREVTEAIQSYAVKASKPAYEIKRDNVLDAVLAKRSQLCDKKGPDGTQITEFACNDLIDAVKKVVAREMKIVELGRELQSIATSYELPLRAGQDGDASVTTSTMGILNIWRARGEETKETTQPAPAAGTKKSDPLMRSLRIDETDTESIAKKIATALKEIDNEPGIAEEQRKAAVWRYNAGVRLVKGERGALPVPEEYEKKESPPERQYLFKKWESVEQPLTEIWNLMKSTDFTPPLKKGEVVLFSFSKKEMPDNVRLWGYIEAKGYKDYDGDVGLEWAVPIDPVFPSILKKGSDETEPILGWEYPPEPVKAADSASSFLRNEEKEPQDGRVLCNGPFARLGYLCRTPDEESGIKCKESSDGKEDKILLTKCTENVPPRPKPKKEGKEEDSKYKDPEDKDAKTEPEKKEEPKRQTITGPDVCRDIDWQEGGFDVQHDCKIEISCEEKCSETATIGAVTQPKNGQGVIKICMTKDKIQFPATYLLYHELTHAQQYCVLPIGASPFEIDKKKLAEMTDKEIERENLKCCQAEGEGNAAQCDLLEQDGVFLNADGSRKLSSTGIPFDAETCMEALRYVSCSPGGGLERFEGCPTSRMYPNSFVDEIYEAMKNNVADVPEKCEDAIKTPDARMEALKESIENVENVCTPGNATQFQNSIAGTLCLIGACAETSLEKHTAIPGRTGFGVQDEAYPWDGDLKQPPKSGTFLLGIPEGSVILPEYHPRRLLQKLDADLCQQVGLPPKSPSILCVLEAKRRFGTPLQDYMAMAQGLASNAVEQTVAVSQREELSMAVGIRIGTALYADEIRRFGLSLGEIMRTAERLLKAMKDTTFPTEMCQIGT